MVHDYCYISKHDPKVKAAYKDLIQLLREVQNELRKDFTFQYRIVGSYSRDMITYDAKGNRGYDFDVDIYPNNYEGRFTPKQIKNKLKEAIDLHCKEHGYDDAEDSTRVLTIKVKDTRNSRIEHSIDFAIIRDCADGDEKWQEYIRNNKKQHYYSWERQSKGYYLLPEKIEWLRHEGLWNEVRDLYIDKKNENIDPHIHSRMIFANTVHEVCQKNGYYADETVDESNALGFSVPKSAPLGMSLIQKTFWMN